MSAKKNQIERYRTERTAQNLERRLPPPLGSIQNDRKTSAFEPISTAC